MPLPRPATPARSPFTVLTTVCALVYVGFGCTPPEPPGTQAAERVTAVAESAVPSPRDSTLRARRALPGARMIPIATPAGDYEVYVRQIGESDALKVLTLHGGPGGTHEFWEPLAEHLPAAGVELYYYDQLGSYFSDQPSDTTLWTIERFVDEVEQVRRAIGADASNFVVLGQSWGGILGMEYALRHQDKLKGLVVSNMMSSIPDYNRYVMERLAPKLPAAVRDTLLAIEGAGAYDDPRYLSLLERHYYPRHVINMPLARWPEAVNRAFAHLNPEVYVYMQGPSEFGVKGDATLADWDITARLGEIRVPTLVIAGGEDTMDPDYLRMMSERMPNGSYLLNPTGGHLVQFDSPDTYYPGLLSWLGALEQREQPGEQ